MQKQRFSDYDAEYYLDKTLKINNIDFHLDGRADAVKMSEKSAEIVEIKTSDVEFKQLPDSILTLYWGQIKTYAYLLMDKFSQYDEVNLTLTYVQTPDDIIHSEHLTISKDDAKQFFDHLIKEYEEWLKLRTDIIKKRNRTAKQMKFPFAKFRKGQRELAAVVYKTIASQKHLFTQAPTGTGKTISTLFPAVKAMGEDLANRIFYLTAKQSTRAVAQEAMDLMMKKGLFIKSITLSAKEKITFEEEADLKPEDNPYMIGYYDRLKPAIKDALEHENEITFETIQQYARQYKIDPFEFSLDLSQFCDVIICDYNYLFDPQVHLQRYFTVEDSDNVFLIDEAHNLVNRSRDMYSAQLSNRPLDNLIKQSKDNVEENEALHKALKSFKRSYTINTKPLTDGDENYVNLDHLLKAFNKQVSHLSDVISDWLAKDHDDDELNDAIVDYYFQLISYQKISDWFDDTFKTRLFYDRDGYVIVKLFCMDPSYFLAQSLQLGGSAILFSATLSPMDYYQRVLGDEDDSLTYEMSSPFEDSHQQIIMTNYIETTYKKRDQSITPIVQTIDAMIKSKTGHYLIFLPSTHYLTQVVEAFQKKHPTIDTIVQKSHMEPDERQDFIDTFKHDDNRTLVGFALLGGIFCEGIDLKGTHLIGVGIVSVGLPGLNPENDLIKHFFDAENGHGFDFAYQLPGLNNVFQAAGRLIRTNKDLGNVVLMDRRFQQRRYRRFFPRNWNSRNLATSYNLKQTQQLLQNFWRRH